MRRVLRWMGRLALVLLLIVGAVWAFGPVDGVDRTGRFDASVLPPDLDAYLASREQQFSDIVPGAEKRIVWAEARGAKTPLAVVYLHGFSATSEEIRPVPDRVAAALGANLYYARLAGHGRGGAALATATAGDWIVDLREALAIGRQIGDRVLVIGTSTGGTLAALAATDPEMASDLAGIVFISPNFGLRAAAARILDMPAARWWGPVVAGAERSFAPQNDTHATFWTTTYPTVALFPMAALVREARAQDYGRARTPALFLWAEADQVIDPARAAAVTQAWAGPVRIERRVMGPGDDPYSHVIAGAALSPGQTDETVEIIMDWAHGL